MTTGYRRVSKRHPCSICGKGNWCSTTWDRDISFCARSTANADRLSRNGWGVYYVNRETPVRPSFPALLTSRTRRSQGPSTPIAPVELRNQVYREFLHLSPFLTSGDAPDAEGCLLDFQFNTLQRYGRLPKTVSGRRHLVNALTAPHVESNLPSHTLIGVPGFWKARDGSVRLGCDFDLARDFLLIPFYDPSGLIQAFQMRALGGTPSPKYSWLSSIQLQGGCGPGTPLHHQGAVNFKGEKVDTVLVTEGALKAATAQHYLPDRYVVGNSGVATSHREIVKAARGKTLEIAFDADCFTNPHVARSLASLITLRKREQQFLRCDRTTRVLTWDKHLKGIDDALLAGASLNQLSVREWLNKLTPECMAVAAPQFADLIPLE